MGWGFRTKVRVPRTIIPDTNNSHKTNNNFYSSPLFIYLTGIISGILVTDEIKPYLQISPSSSSSSSIIPNNIFPSLKKDNGTKASTSVILPELTLSTTLPITTINDILHHQATVTGNSNTTNNNTAITNNNNPIHNLPTNIYRRISDHYISEYDPFTRNPRWVYEHLTSNNVLNKDNLSRTDIQFKEDTSIPVYIRARLQDYNNSGYDRGHLAPAANHRNDYQAMQDTFYLSNISPQIGKGFNRDYWARFEKFIRNLVNTNNNTNSSFEHVYVVTGPAYIPKYKTNNDSNSTDGQWIQEYPLIGTPLHWIHVPTHYYKVVLTETSDNSMAIAAFLIPNQSIPSNTDIKKYIVPVSTITTLTGLSFFQHKLTNEQIIYADKMDSYNILGKNKIDLVDNLEHLLIPKESSKAKSLMGTLFQNNYSLHNSTDEQQTNQQNLETVVFKGYTLPSSKPTSTFRTVRHLCAVNDCTLPNENWYLSSSSSKKSESLNKKSAAIRTDDSADHSLDSMMNDIKIALREEVIEK